MYQRPFCRRTALGDPLTGRLSVLLVLAAVAAAVAACESSSLTTTAPTPPKCQLTLAAPSSIGADGGTGTISVTAEAECAWNVSTPTSWISALSPEAGQGSGKVDFRAAPNPLPSVREGEILINDDRVRVSQDATPCRFTIEPADLTVPPAGGDASVSVSALDGCPWTAKSNVSWITITSGATGTGNGSVAFRVASSSGEPRTGTLTVADRTHTVTQTAAPCTFAINPTSASLPASGGTGSVNVSAASWCTWRATTTVSWITITSGATGTGNGSVVFHVASSSGEPRTGTLTVADRTHTVTQTAAPCTFAINPTSASLPASGGTGSVNVSAASWCTWRATTTVSWISITSGTTGSGTNSVSYSVAANTGSLRSGTLTIAGHAFTVTQAPSPAACTYEINPTSVSMPAAGGTGSVDVTSGNGCPWTSTTTESWISITSGVTGSGTSNVSYSVTPNTHNPRNGTITIAGRTFTITQAGT